ncbi:hypothetical protein [Rufibacter hautae]|uniref:Uncharacterized protein n=1 Tax=Rufibacter hautae TaxID=2595005 RepID=A0A5B6TGL5_9BACT|nr:hypothetical protein [Rufibacter hautae]KAA3438455.1 hypothetical protein FOA19_14565 [Rufibacter hautae]
MNKGGFLSEIFQQWGFTNGRDYLITVLGIKAMPAWSLLLNLVGAAVTGLFVFMAKWVWEPPGAALLIIGMELLNARYGYLVSKKIKGEPFSVKKFRRTFGMVASDVLLLSMIHHAIKFYPNYSPLSHLLFGWLFLHRAQDILKHMTDLKLQDGGLAGFLRRWLMNRLRSEVGAHIVDNIQLEEQKESVPIKAE